MLVFTFHEGMINNFVSIGMIFVWIQTSAASKEKWRKREKAMPVIVLSQWMLGSAVDRYRWKSPTSPLSNTSSLSFNHSQMSSLAAKNSSSKVFFLSILTCQHYFVCNRSSKELNIGEFDSWHNFFFINRESFGGWSDIEVIGGRKWCEDHAYGFPGLTSRGNSLFSCTLYSIEHNYLGLKLRCVTILKFVYGFVHN